MKEKEDLSAMIDWVQVTFKDKHLETIFHEVLGLYKDFMTYESRGRFRYIGKWSFGGIEVLVPPDDYLEMGYHIYMTGKACRSFEIYLRGQKRTWFDFLETCLALGGKFTRLDIAIDDRKTYFAIDDLVNKMEKKECISKFKRWSSVASGIVSGGKSGSTLNLGSRESNVSMCFYEKNYEQARKTNLPLEYYGEWNRYEVCLRKEMADSCIMKLLEDRNLDFIGLSIINYYIRFLIEDEEQKRRDRWKIWKPWELFIEDMEKIKLTMEPAPRTLEQKKNWVETYVAPTLKMIQMADDHIGEDFLKTILKGVSLRPEQKQLVYDYLEGVRELEMQQENIAPI